MKRFIIPAALVMILAALPLLAFHGSGHRGCPGHPGQDGGMGGPDIMGMAMHLLHLGEELGLSDQQKTEIGAILDAARPRMEELQNSMQESREQWREGFDPANFDEQEARNFAESQAAIHVELMVLGMKTRSQVFAILTPEQQEQLQSFREEGGPAGYGHHKGTSHHKGCKGRS